MISVRDTNLKELKEMTDMGHQIHVGEFLSKKSLEKHQKDFKNDGVFYLSIINSSGLLAGYVIICKEKQAKTVQLKRILIDEKYLGIGQKAITSVENYCIRKFNSHRIWLDVYENNSKAIYVYEKLNYIKFKETADSSKSILFFEKWL